MILDVAFSTESTALKVDFSENCDFAINFGQVTEIAKDNHEHYCGDCDVVPCREQTVLETQDKIVDDDIIVHPIPYYQVSNLAGGKTLYIGGSGELEITRGGKTNGKQ